MVRGIVGTLFAATALLWASAGASAGGGGCPGGDEYCLGPAVTILKGPEAKTVSRRATFRFRSNNRDATFRCKLDNGAYRRCESPKKVRRLEPGEHVFRVQAAVGGLGGPVAKHRWKVVG